MSSEITLLSYLPLLFTAVIAAHTPGPNNIMLLQSTMLFGYRKTLPHILGIVVGFNTLVFLVSSGIFTLFELFPSLLYVLKIIGTAYFIWFSYKIITMDVVAISQQIHSIASDKDVQKDTMSSHRSDGKKHIIRRKTTPFTFFQAFFFQWINIKALFFTLSVISLLPGPPSWGSTLTMLSITCFTTISSANIWSLIGVLLNRLIKHTKLLTAINVVLGLALLWFCVQIWI